MSIFLSEEERKQFELAAGDPLFCGHRQALFDRVLTKTLSISQDKDSTTSFWHNAAEYIGDAAFAGAVSDNKAIKDYVRRNALAIANFSDDNWTGPAFRQRTNPPRGHLETAHLSIALSLALDLCKDAFSRDEYDLCAGALKNKAIPLCKAWLDNKPHFLNNWNAVLTCGIAMPAAVLKLDEELDFCAGYISRLPELLQSDGSYGEGLQYGNYFLWAFLLANEAIVRSGRPSASLERAGKYLEYCHYNLLTNKTLSNWGAYPRPRCFNFDDCTAIFAPNPDVLSLLGTRLKESMPQYASLARNIMERFYSANFDQGPFDRTSFGFVPRAGWMTLLFTPQMSRDTKISTSFEPAKSFKNGTTVIRTGNWDKNSLAVALKAPAPEGLGSAGHRHFDINSMQLFFGNERLLADPGHTCYRSLTRSDDTATVNHSTCTFNGKNGEIKQLRFPVRQTLADGSFGEPVTIPGKLEFCGSCKEISAIVSDASDCYDNAVKLFRRTIVVCGGNTVFVIDDIDTIEEVKTSWTWCLNNRDGLLRYSGNNSEDFAKISARRVNAGLAIFNLEPSEISTSSPRYGFLHDAYHPDADGPGRGNAGTALLAGHHEKNCMTGFRRRIFMAAADFYGQDTLWTAEKISALSGKLSNPFQSWQIDAQNREKIVITGKDGNTYTLVNANGTWHIEA